tara:strand:- start:155 stop:1741 length:1587 start_codon:yes stop_codon:yes gene_type:complete
MGEPTLSVDYMDLVRVVARQMGYGSTYSESTVTASGTTVTLTSGTWPAWAGNAAINIGGAIYGITERASETTLTTSATVTTVSTGLNYVLVQSITDDKADTFRDIQDVIDQAYQELCFPLPSDESYFIWSWLLERKTISFEDNVANYDLAENFGQFIDTSITYKAGLDLPSVTLLSQKEYRGEQSRDSSSGIPQYLMWRQKSFTASTGRRFEALLYPTPVSDQFPDPEYSTGTLTSADEVAHDALPADITDSDTTIGTDAVYAPNDQFLINREIIKVTAVDEKNITGATTAEPIVITATAHGFENGDRVDVDGVGGLIGADGYFVVAGKTADTFKLQDSDGTGTYTSGGTVTRITVARGQLGTTATSHVDTSSLYKQGTGKRVLVTGGTLPVTPATLIIPGGSGVEDTTTSIPTRESDFIIVTSDGVTLSETSNWKIRHNITTFSRDSTSTFDGEHLEYMYRVIPDALTPTNRYPLCGAIHGDTLMKACQAVAERKLGDDAGIYEAKFKERMEASIALDRAVKATMGI